MINKGLSTVLFITLFSLIVQAQKVPLLFSIKDTKVSCISPNEESIFGITWFESQAKIVQYDMNTGKVKKEYESTLPSNPITLIHAVPNSSILYLISARKIDDSKNTYMDAIYQFNTKTGKLKLLYIERMKYKAPYRIGMVAHHLVFTTQKEPTRIYNIKQNFTDLLNPNIDYQLLSIAPEQKGYLMMNIKKIHKNQVPVYFMNPDRTIRDSIGAINPDLIIQTKKSAFQLPTLSLADSNYFWAIKAIRYNCFPLYSIKIGIHPFWLKQVYSLEKADEASAITDASKNYIIMSNNQAIDVYKIEYKKGDLNDVDIAEIEILIEKRGTTNRLILNADKTNPVFNALFYHVVSSGKDLDNINKKLVAQQYGSYHEIDSYDKLLPLFNNGFSISNEQQSLIVQDALEILYPIDEFNRQFIRNYKLNNQWIFIRGKAFDKFYGIALTINDSGIPTTVEYISDL